MRTPTCLAAAAVLALPLQAADTPAPPPPRPAAAAPADPLGAARARIAASDWPGALAALQAARDERSADWHNLMGFALRSQATPDYPGAEQHYNNALRINPAHRGALEYAGELYLKTNRRPQAEAQLAALAKACPNGCPELDDLKAALARHKP